MVPEFRLILLNRHYLGEAWLVISKSFGNRVIFFTIPNAKVSAERVRIRVNKGGHDVPIEDIKRRYLKTHRNFWNLYRGLADRWFLYDNQKQEHGLISLGEKDQYSVKKKSTMEALYEELREVPLADMSEEMQKDAQVYWGIFDRGVKKAKAENDRLGIIVNEDVDYRGVAAKKASVPKVAESED